MRWIRKMSAETRLSIVFAALTLLAAWFAGSAILNAVTYQSGLAGLKNLQTDGQRRSAAVQNVIYEEISLRSLVLDPTYAEFYLADILRYRETFAAYLQYELMSSDPDTVSTAQDLQSVRTAHDQEVDIIIDLALAGADMDEILGHIDETLFPLENELLYTLRYLEQGSIWNIQYRLEEMQYTSKAIAQSGSLALLALGLILVVGILTVNDIFQPLLALSNAIHQFEANQFSPRLLQRHTARADELGEITRSFSVMATAMIESNKLKEKFLSSASRFIPSQYLEFLEKDDITKVDLGDNVAAEMAVMFSDIRGFTTMSETMTAQQNFDFVNDYLKQVSPIIQEHEGFIVKFLGDGMMAIFPYGVEDAVKAGIAKQQMVKAFNAQTALHGLPPISVGIGIHTGSMMVGMIGEEARLQGDAFSDNVNLTSRLEGLNKFFGTSMLISEDTLAQLGHPEQFKMRFLGRAIVKGRIAPLGLYEVYQGLGDEIVALHEATKAHFERGLALYTQGQFAAAHEAFRLVLDQNPDDKTAQYYLESCAHWLRQTLPAGWDGVITMDSK